MVMNIIPGGGFGWGMGLAALAPMFLALMLWSVFWKGLALWHSAQRKEPWWFVALLIINTAGILEIVYLFLVAKLKLADLFRKA